MSDDPTAEQLIEILKPNTDVDGLGAARGISIAPRAKCSLRRPSGARGIALKPISRIATLYIQFAYNSAEILPEASRRLDELGKALASDVLAPSCFQIKGHTDSIGSDAYNDRLSQRRADAVVHYLTAHFRIEQDRLDALGLGKRHPIADNSTEEGRSHNRRVEVVNVNADPLDEGEDQSRPSPGGADLEVQHRHPRLVRMLSTKLFQPIGKGSRRFALWILAQQASTAGHR
jgi:outer membrane protein OmpA-like peptidoglycan-associated protein